MGWAGVILGDLIEVRWDSESYSPSQVMLARVSFFFEFKQKSFYLRKYCVENRLFCRRLTFFLDRSLFRTYLCLRK